MIWTMQKPLYHSFLKVSMKGMILWEEETPTVTDV